MDTTFRVNTVKLLEHAHLLKSYKRMKILRTKRSHWDMRFKVATVQKKLTGTTGQLRPNTSVFGSQK